jgi:NAD(P)H dehydrogenase (quinone)
MVTKLVNNYRVTIMEVLCNPRPGSFTLALAAHAKETLEGLGHEVLLHDLYKECFDPVLDASELVRSFSLDGLVQSYCRELSSSGGLVVLHPDWWGQPPAVLKGWVDRVFRQGVAYDLEGDDFSEKSWKPLLTGKKGLVFCTSDTAEADAPKTLETLWTDSILGRCGMKAACHVMRDLRRTDPAVRRAWLSFMSAALKEWFPRAA